jgi:hypothetical protein
MKRMSMVLVSGIIIALILSIVGIVCAADDVLWPTSMQPTKSFNYSEVKSMQPTKDNFNKSEVKSLQPTKDNFNKSEEKSMQPTKDNFNKSEVKSMQPTDSPFISTFAD